MKVSKRRMEKDWKKYRKELFIEKAVSTDYEPKNTPYKSIEIDTLAVFLSIFEESIEIFSVFRFDTFSLKVSKYLLLPGIDFVEFRHFFWYFYMAKTTRYLGYKEYRNKCQN